MGFPNAQRVDVPLWTVNDIKWVAIEAEKFYLELKSYGWGRHDLDPLERVLHARWSTIRLAHALRHRTSNLAARQIVSGLPRIPD